MQKSNLLPSRHLVDTGYVDAELVVESSRKYGIELFGPMRLNPCWQAREGGIEATQFQIDWDNQKARCPMGKQSAYWSEYQTERSNFVNPSRSAAQAVVTSTVTIKPKVSTRI